MADDAEGSNFVLYWIKGLLATIPTLLIASLVFVPFSLAIVAITLYRLPMNVYKTTKIAMWTVVLQWDLRVVVLILLPLIHTLFPLVAFSGALVMSFLWAWILAASNIFEGGHPLDEFDQLKNFVKEYHQEHKDFVSNERWGRYDHPTGIPYAWDGTSYGLEIERILKWQRDFVICCGMVLLQIPVCLTGSALSSALNYIPTCMYGWKQYIKECCCSSDQDCVSVLSIWPFHVLALALLPVGILIIHFLGVLYSGFLRPFFQTPWEYLVGRVGLCAACKLQLQYIGQHDEIFEETGGFRIFQCCYKSETENDGPYHGRNEAQGRTRDNSKEEQNESVTTYWGRFASQCIQSASTLIEQRWIDVDDVADMVPSAIQSVPAVAILKILVDSVQEKGLKRGDIKWSIDGTVCKENQRPTGDGIINRP